MIHDKLHERRRRGKLDDGLECGGRWKCSGSTRKQLVERLPPAAAIASLSVGIIPKDALEPRSPALP